MRKTPQKNAQEIARENDVREDRVINRMKALAQGSILPNRYWIQAGLTADGQPTWYSVERGSAKHREEADIRRHSF